MVGYRWFLVMIVVLTAARLVLVSVGLPRTRIPVFRTPSPSSSVPRSPDGPATSGYRRSGLETQGPDLEAASEERSRTSLRSPPWCHDAGYGRFTADGLGLAAGSMLSGSVPGTVRR